MLESIEQLFGMFAVMGALCASSQMMLVAESSDDMMMFTSLQQAALNVFSYQVLSLLEDAVRMYYQKNPPKWQENDLVSGGHGPVWPIWELVDNELGGSAPHQCR